MIICLGQDADYMAQPMPLPLSISCFSQMGVFVVVYYKVQHMYGIVSNSVACDVCILATADEESTTKGDN